MDAINTECPITMERLADMDPSQIYYHMSIGMDVEALYAFLLQSVYFVNPVNRVPFQLEDLADIENMIRARHGPNAVTTQQETEEEEVEQTASITATSPPHLSDELLREHMRVTIRDADRQSLRLHVDLDLPDEEEEEDDEEKIMEEETPAVQDRPPSPTSPPLRFPVPSLVQAYLDAGRSRRMQAEINMIHYLHHEATSVLRQMTDFAVDANFQREVWAHTSVAVMDLVMNYVRRHMPDSAGPQADEGTIHEIHFHTPTAAPPPTPPDTVFNLEVVYSEQWDLYRLMVMHVLEKQYTYLCRALRTLSVSEFDVLCRQHHDLVTQEVADHPEATERLALVTAILDHVQSTAS